MLSHRNIITRAPLFSALDAMILMGRGAEYTIVCVILQATLIQYLAASHICTFTYIYMYHVNMCVSHKIHIGDISAIVYLIICRGGQGPNW